jgi:4-amino-4-deoxy-L-arabinose transferase-like glycosyltransferase
VSQPAVRTVIDDVAVGDGAARPPSVAADDPRDRRRDLLILLGLLALAALLRIPDLATRGTWDGDQGHDMLVLRALVRDGVVPLLGPPTSIGDVHHGAWYYYLLSPAAFLTGGDSPLAVVALIAAAGVAAVGVVWWLARSIGGWMAGFAAGFVIATSAAAIDESTFIWNPNLIALSSAIALAGAWRAWSGGGRWWWLVAAVGVAITMQCHVLGVALLPIVGAAFVLDARRRPLGRVALGCLLVLVAAFLPLAVNELTTGFSELHAALDYVAGGGDRSATALPVRFVVVGIRVVSWPLVGLVTDGLAVASLVTIAVVAIIAWAWRPRPMTQLGATPAVSWAARWLGLGLLWTAAFLTVAAPSLASVVPGLPNDHYHAFADPMVFVLVGLGAGMALQGGVRRPAGVAAVAAVVLLTAWNVGHLPPAVHPDGGYPAGQAAGDRADAALTAAGVARDAVVRVRSLPDFKSTEAMAYPLARLGRAYIAETPRGVAPGSAGAGAAGAAGAGAGAAGRDGGLILLCDDRFAEAIGAACGGPAEAAALAAGGGAGRALLDRFEAAPGRFVSVYGVLARS